MKKNNITSYILSFIVLTVYPPLLISSEEKPFYIWKPYIPLASYSINNTSKITWAALLVPEVRVDGADIYIDGFLTLYDDNTFTLDRAKKLNKEEIGFFSKIRSRPCGLADTLGRFSAYRNTVKKGTYCLSQSFKTVEGDRIVTYLFIEDEVIQTITDYRNDLNGGTNHPFDNWLYETAEFGYIDDNNEFIKEDTLSNIQFEREYILKLMAKDGTERMY